MPLFSSHPDRAGRGFAYAFLRASRGVTLTGIDKNDAGRIREATEPVAQFAVA